MSFYDDGKQVLSGLESYYRESIPKEKKVVRQQSIRTLHKELDLTAHLKNGDLTGESLDTFLKTYLDNTTRLHHPGFLSHQVGVPHPTWALGSLIDGFTNNAMSIYEMGPAAAAIEFFIVNMLLEKIGWTNDQVYLSLENRMKCGQGVCCHCNVGPKLVCKDGPVFTRSQVNKLPVEY